jgi:hypothetical protein
LLAKLADIVVHWSEHEGFVPDAEVKSWIADMRAFGFLKGER